MITDKDELDAKIIIDMVGGNSDKWREIRDYTQRIRAESAEQARKEAAERVACAWREHGEDITLRMLRESILGDSAPVSTDAEKLAIAVKALEKIQKQGTYNPLGGRKLSGERIDSEKIINEYGIIARDALKEIQG